MIYDSQTSTYTQTPTNRSKKIILIFLPILFLVTLIIALLINRLNSIKENITDKQPKTNISVQLTPSLSPKLTLARNYMPILIVRETTNPNTSKTTLYSTDHTLKVGNIISTDKANIAIAAIDEELIAYWYVTPDDSHQTVLTIKNIKSGDEKEIGNSFYNTDYTFSSFIAKPALCAYKGEFYFIEANKTSEEEINDVPESKGYFLVKHFDKIKDTGEEVYRIANNDSFSLYKDNEFKTPIYPFVFSQDCTKVAFSTTHATKSDQEIQEYYKQVHVVDLSSSEDKVIYREDLTQDNFEEFLGFEKKPVFFSKDNSSVFLINYTEHHETPNEKLYAIKTDGSQQSATIVTDQKLTKVPLLSPEGNVILTMIVTTNYESSQIVEEIIELKIYDTSGYTTTFADTIRIPIEDGIDNTYIVDPYFVNDTTLVINAGSNLFIIDTQEKTVTDLTDTMFSTDLDKSYTRIFWSGYLNSFNKIEYSLSSNIGMNEKVYLIDLQTKEIEKVSIPTFHDAVVSIGELEFYK